MRLLVVEGNTKETWVERELVGGVPYHKRFQFMLETLHPTAKVQVAFPADGLNELPSLNEIKSFDGVLWTGSSLYVNDPIESVTGQLDFAETVFQSGIPFYGSCWGLQIAAVVAGGKVGTSPHGREIGITKPIELTEAGANHPYFKGRKEPFEALCIHLDEVIQLPENSVVLAGNEHSQVQALTINYKNSEFFGVQYHPEFVPSDVVFLAKRMSKILQGEGLFESDQEVEVFANTLLGQNGLPDCISNYSLHTQEVKHWLDGIVCK